MKCRKRNKLFEIFHSLFRTSVTSTLTLFFLHWSRPLSYCLLGKDVEEKGKERSMQHLDEVGVVGEGEEVEHLVQAGLEEQLVQAGLEEQAVGPVYMDRLRLFT